MQTLDDLSKDIFFALTDNSGELSGWLANLGEGDPYKAIMTFDKLTGTYQRIIEMGLTGKTDDGFNIKILVDSKEGKSILTELLKDDKANESNDDKAI